MPWGQMSDQTRARSGETQVPSPCRPRPVAHSFIALDPGQVGFTEPPGSKAGVCEQNWSSEGFHGCYIPLSSGFSIPAHQQVSTLESAPEITGDFSDLRSG